MESGSNGAAELAKCVFQIGLAQMAQITEGSNLIKPIQYSIK